jgi:hypothetical protein
MILNHFRTFLILITLALFGTSVLAQGTNANTPLAPPPTTGVAAPQQVGCTEIDNKVKDYDFSDLTTERDLINKEIGSATAKISTLTRQIPQAPTQKEIDDLIKAKRDQAAKSGRIAQESDGDWFVDENTPSKESLKEQLKIQEGLLGQKNAQLRCLDLKISQIDTPEQGFKKTMSIIFAILIGLVIIGFFILSWLDETVRRSIFKSETGIQFLTLFSIVIAIILFGITSILQDKELAALLGGLSGYILGRNGKSSAPSPLSQEERGGQGG